MTTLENILQEIEEIYINDVGLGVECNVFSTDEECKGNSNCFECVKRRCAEIIKNHLSENDRWIPVEKRLPEEHDSMFAKLKGTDRWSEAMFEKISDDVNVTVEYEDGTRKTTTTYTLDGKWKLPNRVTKQKVVAWQPLPEPYRKDDE